VYQHTAGSFGEIVRAPADTTVIRFPFGSCRIATFCGAQWRICGEAAASHVHVVEAGSISRSEWLTDGSELLLMVPDSYWRGRITERMQMALAHGRPHSFSDPILQQLTQLMVRCAPRNAEDAFTRQLMSVIVERMLTMKMPYRTTEAKRHTHRPLAPHRMLKLTAFVRDNLDQAISLQDMATAAGLSPMHFAAQFRAATGKRPHHFLLEERVARAKFLMQGTQLSLYDIALAVGFKTQAHFCTVFKQAVGETPKVWRTRATTKAD
jgi:AraC-like DNA-binding protein